MLAGPDGTLDAAVTMKALEAALLEGRTKLAPSPSTSRSSAPASRDGAFSGPRWVTSPLPCMGCPRLPFTAATPPQCVRPADCRDPGGARPHGRAHRPRGEAG